MVRRARPGKARSAAISSPPRLCDVAVVAITGSIGALWTAQFVLLLRAERHVRTVRVILSDSAAKLVTPVALRAISGHRVLTDLFGADAPFPVGHVEATEDADILVVMPATADIIGKAANGIADDVVSTTILAADCPVVFVPNMNGRMWHRAAVQRNLRALTRDGHHVVPPEVGVAVSTAREESGGMPSFETILGSLRRVIRAKGL